MPRHETADYVRTLAKVATVGDGRIATEPWVKSFTGSAQTATPGRLATKEYADAAFPTTSPPVFSGGAAAGDANGDALVVPIPAGVVAGDSMVLFVRANQYLDATTNMPTPAGWTLLGSFWPTYEGTVGSAYCYTRTADAADADGVNPNVSISVAPDASDISGAIISWSKAGLPTAVVWGGSDVASTSMVAPSVEGVADGELVCAWMQGATTWVGNTATTYPAGMTERAHYYGDSHNGVAAASQPLAAAGATGTRTATRTTSYPYLSASLIIPPVSTMPDPTTGSTVPQNLTATITSLNEIALDWDDVAGFDAARGDYYEIWEEIQTPTQPVTTRTVSERTSGSLDPALNYRYKVRTWFNGAMSEFGTPVDIAAWSTAPPSSGTATWTEAWNGGDTAVLRQWFVDNTGPRVAIDTANPINGTVTINSQADADAIKGKLIVGGIDWRASNVIAEDFEVRSIGGRCLNFSDPGTDPRGNEIRYFKLDGGDYQRSTGLGGISYFQANVHHAEIVRCGDDSARWGAGGCIYEYLFIHDVREWNTTTDGTYSSSTDPHTDGIQCVRGSGHRLRYSWVDLGTKSPNDTGVLLIKADSAAISDMMVESNYLNGGHYTCFVHDGGGGSTTGVTISNNRFGRNYGTGLWSFSPAGKSVTRSGNVWADTKAAVPLSEGPL